MVRAAIVYESIWGNTAAAAQAIRQGFGPRAVVLSTAQATQAALEGTTVIIVGAPVIGFGLPTARARESISTDPAKVPAPPDLSHPPLEEWLGAAWLREALPPATVRFVAFETKMRGPFGHAVTRITRILTDAGYRTLAAPESFIVTGRYGPLGEDELERARRWGAGLASMAAE